MIEPKLILASGSPRRREILSDVGLKFTVVASNVDEEEIASRATPGHPEEVVTLLAEAKAREIARTTQENAIVIGADTIVWLDGEALNKPRDENHAIQMLLSLAGRTHQVYTGIAVMPAGGCVLNPAITGYEMSEVEFYPISESDAREYVATGEPMDKAGGYGIQDIGKKFAKSLSGDYHNVVGLPINLLSDLLSQFGITVQPIKI